MQIGSERETTAKMLESERAAMTRVRGALETVFSPGATSTLLFEALERFSKSGAGKSAVPSTTDELLLLIRGGLLEALARRMDEAQAKSTVQRVEDALTRDLGMAGGATTTPPSSTRSKVQDPDTTMAVPVATLPVSVCVVAATPQFRDRLDLSLGPRRVAAVQVSTLSGLSDVDPPPAIVVLDSSDFAAIEPEPLHLALKKFPRTTVHVVWATDLPYGRSVSALLSKGLSLVQIEQSDGIEPLLDLIRSRRRVAS